MSNVDESVELQVRQYGYGERLYKFAIVDKTIRIDIEAFLKEAFHIYENELDRVIGLHNMVKSITILTAEFEKSFPKLSESVNANDVPSSSANANVIDTPNNSASDGYGKVEKTLHFPSPTVLMGLDSDLEAHYRVNIIEELLKAIENIAIQGSGFTLTRIVELVVQTASYEPLRGASFIETPKRLDRKRAIINVQNKFDDMCFKWSVLTCLNKDKIKSNPHRVQNYKQFKNDLNFDGIDFPVNSKDVDKFVKQNDNISINIYNYDNSADIINWH